MTEAILIWIQKLLVEINKKPIVIGVNGPQGSGKTTLTTKLVQILAEKKLKAITVSIDDFYLTHSKQIALAKKNPTNPYLQQRGYPGTHNIALGEKILTALTNRTSNDKILCPVYDKSKYLGEGDQLPVSEWKTIQPPLDFVFFEGWMLGFSQVKDNLVNDPNLKEINSFIESYKSWYKFLDAFLFLEPFDINYIIDWRVEAEEKMRIKGKEAMSPDAITNYVKKFIPAYEVYLPQLLKNPPVKKHNLHFVLGKNRLPKN